MRCKCVQVISAAMVCASIQMAGANVFISEFMAVNDSHIQDEDGDRSDWIELYNAGGTVVNLGGWHLTDKADDLTKWTFPPITLNPGRFLIVRASSKNRKDPDEELHTNFKLSGSGEYLALVKPDEVTVAHEFAPAYPEQVNDVSCGFAMGPSSASNLTVIAAHAPIRALVPTDGSLDYNNDAGLIPWTLPGFDDSAWTAGTAGVGYEQGSGYESLINLDVGSSMYNARVGLYTRTSFTLPTGLNVDRAELKLKYDDGFFAYINGELVADANMTGSSWDSDADTWREANNFDSFSISSGNAFLSGSDNVLAIHVANDKDTSSDLLILPELTVSLLTPASIDTNTFKYFTVPTPGEENAGGTDHIGPRFYDEQHLPVQPTATEDLTVTVSVSDQDGVSWVNMIYEIMFDGETSIPMTPTGNGAYSAVIPASAYTPGEMIRYRFESEDGAGHASRFPLFHDPLNAPEFFGTMAQIDVESTMPVYHWFIDQSRYGADSSSESRSSMFYNGVLYDNIMTRTRGGSTSNSSMPKKSHKFDFNTAHHFKYAVDAGKVEEMNLNTTYSDKTYLRRMLAWNAYEAIDAPGCKSFLVHLRRNNQFFGVQNFEEQVDDDFLERHGFDPNGALFKVMGEDNSVSPQNRIFNQKTRRHDPLVDEARDLVTDLQQSNRESHAFDRMDVANLINYVTLTTLMRDGDTGRKNQYFYRDVDGSGDWYVFPWDKDLTYGMKWASGTTIFHDECEPPVSMCIPGGGIHQNVVWKSGIIKQLYLRRLRSVLDQLLQEASTPTAQRWHESRIADLLATHMPDLMLDYQVWGEPWTYGIDADPGEMNTNLTINTYLAGARSYFYGNSSLPDAQPANVSITISHVEVTPASGNQLEEYIELSNPNNFAVDISGWSLSNAVTHVFRGGSVVPANGKFYVSPHTGVFRTRTTGPRAGQKLFVQGAYKGMLSSRGETLELYNEKGLLKDAETWSENLSDAQRWLRVSEVMYHPDVPNGSELTEDRLEFIELINIGAAPLDIDGTFFTSGLIFTNPAATLPAGGRLVIASDPAEFANQYDTAGIAVVGPFDGFLSNGSDEIELEDHRGETIQRFAYKDWYRNTDGRGFSLTLVEPAHTNLTSWSEKEAWRPSLDLGGSPGVADADLAPGSVGVNELLAHSDTGADWVELKNLTDAPVDVGHWFLSDDRDEPLKFQIPAATVIPAQGLVVFTESLFNTGPKAFAFSELGDEVVLTKALADGTPQGYQYIRSFDATGKDIPLGRWIDSEGDEQFVAMATPTPNAENSAPLTGPVLISEIMYAPAAGFAEYVELHNSSSSSIPLRDLAHPTNGWSLASAVDFSFAADAEIAPRETLLICSTNPAAFRTQYGVGAEIRVLGPYTGRLNAAGERIKLYRPGNPEPTLVPQILEESVNYKPSAPWPVVAPASGLAIERVSTASPANEPTSWKLSSAGGSPGAVKFALTPIELHLVDWTALYFGDPPMPGSGEFDDYDLDGRFNRDEWIEGTNPTNAGDEASVQWNVSNGVMNVWIEMRATDAAIAHGIRRYYTLESKTNLTDAAWMPIPGKTEVLGTNQSLSVKHPIEGDSFYIRSRINLR